ncbi:MAG: glutamate--tRNA ligase [Candidatus Dormiibacterota bacterium]
MANRGGGDPGSTVRVRMAPSPTGYVHLGSARTMLFNFLFARGRGGALVLRVDDTDTERNRPEFEQTIFDGFHWLGLDWDEGPDVGGPHGPYRQSERIDRYRELAARLLQQGSAYRCYCTREELDAERRAAREQGIPYRYSRRCLTNPPKGRTEFAVRLLVPEGESRFDDLIRGELRFDNAGIGDPVIVRTDGSPLYNFTSTVDDVDMAITHVIRGEEHLSNTPIQLMLFDALDAPRPQAFAHVPVIVGADHQKLSKRRHPEVRLGLYEEQGYLPAALVNYLALLGWNPGTEQEIWSLAELVPAFSLERVQRSPAMFDRDRLDWLNGHYIRELSDDELAELLQRFLPGLPPATLRAAAPALKERLPRLDQAGELLAYLEAAPDVPTPSEPQREMLQEARSRLAPLDSWNAEAIEAALESAREANGWSRGKFFTPIRQAVAGRVSPPLHSTLALLPKEEALSRIDAALGAGGA